MIASTTVYYIIQDKLTKNYLVYDYDWGEWSKTERKEGCSKFANLKDKHPFTKHPIDFEDYDVIKVSTTISEEIVIV